MVPQGLVAAWSLNSPDVKHVLTVHSAGLFLLRRIPLGKRFARHILKHTDALYIVSENNHRMLEDLVRRPVKATIAPMGIHTEYYRQGGDPAELKQKLNLPQEGPIILFVGKLSRIKGVRFLLQAWPEVLKQFPAATLVIVGSGPEEAALKEAAGKLEEASRIRFVGQKNQEAVRDYLKVCDAVVIPQFRTPTGRSKDSPWSCWKPWHPAIRWSVPGLAAYRSVSSTEKTDTPSSRKIQMPSQRDFKNPATRTPNIF